MLQTLQEERNRSGAMAVAQESNLTEQPRAVAAALGPALDQIGLIRGQDPARRAVRPAPFGWTVESQIAVHRAATRPDDLGNVQDGEPSRLERSHPLVPLHRGVVLLLTDGFRPLLPGDQHGRLWAGQRSENSLAQPCRPLEGRSEAEQAAFQGVNQILEQMPAIGHLDDPWRPFPGRLGVGRCAITTDNLDTRVSLEPVNQRLRFPLREQLNDPALLEVDQDGAVVVALAEGPVINPEHSWRWLLAQRCAPHQPQQRCWTDRHAEAGDDAGTRFAAQREGQHREDLGQPQGAPRPGCHQLRQPFGEDATRTLAGVTEELPDNEEQRHRVAAPGQVGERTLIDAVSPLSQASAQRAGRGRPCGDQRSDDLNGADGDLVEPETRSARYEPGGQGTRGGHHPQ